MERGSPCVWEGSHLAGGGVAWGVKGVPVGVEMSYIWSVVQINMLRMIGSQIPPYHREAENYQVERNKTIKDPVVIGLELEASVWSRGSQYRLREE